MARADVHALVCRSLFPLDVLVVPLQVSAAQVGEHDPKSRADMPSSECRVVNMCSCARCLGRRAPHLCYFKSRCCVRCVSGVELQASGTIGRFKLNNINIRTPRSTHCKQSNAPFETRCVFERTVRSYTPNIILRYKHRTAPSRVSNAAFANSCSRNCSSTMI